MHWISVDDSIKPRSGEKVKFKRILELEVTYIEDNVFPASWIADRDTIEMKEYWMPLPKPLKE